LKLDTKYILHSKYRKPFTIHILWRKDTFIIKISDHP